MNHIFFIFFKIAKFPIIQIYTDFDCFKVSLFLFAFGIKETRDHLMKSNTQSLIERFTQCEADVRGYVR